MWIFPRRGDNFAYGENEFSPGEDKMNNAAESQKTAQIVAIANRAEARKALAVLEQMYGYFTFEQMPLEVERLAA
mgnify:CR=1 FL=1